MSKATTSDPAGKQRISRWLVALALLGIVLLSVGGYLALARTASAPGLPVAIKPVLPITFKAGFTDSEKQQVQRALSKLKPELTQSLIASVETTNQLADGKNPLAAYVVVASPYSPLDTVERFATQQPKVYIEPAIEKSLGQTIAQSFGLNPNLVTPGSAVDEQLQQDPGAVAILPADQLTTSVKLLKSRDSYYLDSFSQGAVYRTVRFSGPGENQVQDTPLAQLESSRDILKLNMSGVTAMTRDLMQKIRTTGDGAYPAKNIASFLRDADLTHTSNEVSFLAGCTYSLTTFCAPPESIKALEAIGTDIVELTGNHNNDVGSAANTATINTYLAKNWHAFGGGLNASAAAEPFIADQKNSRVAFLGYNYYDTVHRNAAIASETRAGANSFDWGKMKRDIAAAKAKAQFVIVDVQYQECYSYPPTHTLMPACYKPIGSPDQKADFRRIVDLGADMVIGTQAHQPQTFELYNGKPIYFGLGNLFFDQFEWPGTEQGMILTHYFQSGKLLQTKLSPTVYDHAMQTRLMTEPESETFLNLLGQARPN